MQDFVARLVKVALIFLWPIAQPAFLLLANAGEPSAPKKGVLHQSPARVDAFDDPLPEGALYRLGTLRLRHESAAPLIFSSDGSRLLSYGSALRIWDVATGRLVLRLTEHGRLRQVVASADDRYLAGIANYQDAVVVDQATGKEAARLRHPNYCVALAFTTDGKELFGLSREQTLVRWNIAQGKETARISLDMNKIERKDLRESDWHLSPNGAMVALLPGVATGAKSTTWYFWDTATGKHCLPALTTMVSPDEVRWSSDSRLLAMVARDNTLKVWDTVTGKLLPFQAGRRQAEGSSHTSRGVTVHPQGKLLACAIDGRVTVWDFPTAKQLWSKEMYGSVLAFSPDGKTLAVGGWGITKLVETATGALAGFSRRDPGGINLAYGWGDHASLFSRNSRSFMVHDEAGLSELELATGKRLRCWYPSTKGWASGGLCGDGHLLAYRGKDDAGVWHLFLFEAATGKELWRRPVYPSRLYFSGDGKKLALMSWNWDAWKEDAFTLLDTASGKELAKLLPASVRWDSNHYAAVSDDLALAATSHVWHSIEIWDLAVGKTVRALECPQHWTNGSLYFVPGTALLVGAPQRDYIHRKEKGVWGRIWDTSTGRVRHSFDEPILRMSADGRWLALQGDEVIPIRHLQTGRLLVKVSGTGPVSGGNDGSQGQLVFSPDGSLLAVRHESRHEVGLWDTFTGQRVCRFVEPLARIHSFAFAPDGRTLVLAFRDGGSLLVCDVTGMATAAGKIPARELSPADAERCWRELLDSDGPRSHRARWRLVAAGETTVQMLQWKLRRVEPPDAKELAALVADLDSGKFAIREKSSRKLEGMESARPALEAALQRKPSLELKLRIERILAIQDAAGWGTELRRALRGVLLLEQIGTPSALQLLQTLAGGASGAVLTQEAQAALRRLQMTRGTF